MGRYDGEDYSDEYYRDRQFRSNDAEIVKLTARAEAAEERERVALARITAVVDKYAIQDDDSTLEYTEPEDVWRFFRDIRAALAEGTQPQGEQR